VTFTLRAIVGGGADEARPKASARPIERLQLPIGPSVRQPRSESERIRVGMAGTCTCRPTVGGCAEPVPPRCGELTRRHEWSHRAGPGGGPAGQCGDWDPEVRCIEALPGPSRGTCAGVGPRRASEWSNAAAVARATRPGTAALPLPLPLPRRGPGSGCTEPRRGGRPRPGLVY
jgi:hypothetical protein